MLEAPWIGKCREESYKHDPEFVGYCTDCGCSVYEDDDYDYTNGELYCANCAYVKED